MSTIYKVLSKIQKELKAPKNLFNNFGGYKYRNAEGILEAVKPILPEGYALLLNDEPIMVGQRYYIKAVATLTNGEESVSVTAYAREDEIKKGMDGCQITGSCSSYARKYALNGLFSIDDTKDSDDDALSPKNPANNDPNDHTNDSKPIGGVTVSGGISPVANLMRNEISDIQEKLGINSYVEARKKVFAWGDELMTSGAIDKFNWPEITMDQAKNLFAAIRTVFLQGDVA